MWKRWLRIVRNFFGFTRGEARGFSVLAIILLLVYAGWFVYYLIPAAPYQPLADQQQLDSLIHLLEQRDTASNAGTRTIANKVSPATRQLFFFNPEQVSYDTLLMLGFPAHMAKRLLNYRAKGGRFRKKEDLLKLYGMQQEFYQELEPWIQLPKQAQPVQHQQHAYTRSPAYPSREEKTGGSASSKFDLNKADSLQLLSVRGIGPVLSGRILKFRDGLGGFVDVAQVREVWGLPPEVADLLLERAYLLHDEKPRMLLVNAADVSELARHPYISRKQAEWIVNYRSQHGEFRQPADLLKIHTLDDNFVKKVSPYLQF